MYVITSNQESIAVFEKSNEIRICKEPTNYHHSNLKCRPQTPELMTYRKVESLLYDSRQVCAITLEFSHAEYQRDDQFFTYTTHTRFFANRDICEHFVRFCIIRAARKKSDNDISLNYSCTRAKETPHETFTRLDSREKGSHDCSSATNISPFFPKGAVQFSPNSKAIFTATCATV